jgi:hypothetical protein
MLATMSEPSDLNPYAPPTTDTQAPAVRRKKKRKGLDSDIEEALERLREHLADPAAVAHDKAKAGPRVRPVGWISALVAAAAAAAAIAGQKEMAIFVLGLVTAVVAGILAIVFVALDLSLVPRDQPSSPEATLKAFLKSIAMGRNGYAWSCLCPTAREQTVRTPDIAPVETVEGDFSLASENEFKAYVASFARAGQSKIRTMAVKKVVVAGVDGEVATIDAELMFQSWPQWVSIVIAVGAAVFRPAIIVGIILLYAMRKKREVRCTKTMLRADNGVWYVYDGNLLGSADEE